MRRCRLTIGPAAKAAGVTRKAVRVYEAKGLLPDPQRTAAGYRLYSDHDVARLRFIRRARGHWACGWTISATSSRCARREPHPACRYAHC